TKPIQNRDLLDSALNRLGEFTRRSRKELLVVEPDSNSRARILDCIDSEDVHVTSAADADAAIDLLRREPVDCLVIGAERSELAGALVANAAFDERQHSKLPVIVYGDGELDHAAWKRLGDVCTLRRAHSGD